VQTNASAEVLRVLGDDTRRLILERLAQGPSPVGELARDLPISRSAVSQHLKVLKDARLVVDHAEGTRRVYQVDREGLALLRTYLDLLWTRALAGFEAAAAVPDVGGRDVSGPPTTSSTEREEER
jgi:DNA-binding transcriptional ArsR family regulator